MPAKIIESSERPDGATVLTVHTHRGEDFVIDADALAIAFADWVSDRTNEARHGWSLGVSWWEDEFSKVQRVALAQR